MAISQQSAQPTTELENRPYKAAASLLLADAVMSVGGSFAFVWLLYGRVDSSWLLMWQLCASLPAIALAAYLYTQIIRKDPKQLQRVQVPLFIYRLILSAIWTGPQFFAIFSGDPGLYVIPAYLAGVSFVFNAFINLSIARYFAVFAPMAAALIYITQLLPEHFHILSHLTIALGFLLIPAAYAMERIFFGYLGANEEAMRYKHASAKAERQIENISLALGDSQKRLQLVADNSHDIIILHDKDGKYLFVSNAVTDITGYYPSDLIGNKPSDYVYHKDQATLKKRFEEHGRHTLFNTPSRFRFVCKDGSLVWMETITRPIKGIGQNENLAMVSSSRDVTKQIEFERNLQKQAQLDALTGCYNRSEFDRRLQRMVTNAKDGTQAHALIYVDLDQFKIINDSCGHQAGDALLIDVSRRLKNLTGDKGAVARLGGDEFAILLNNCSTNDASRFANQLRNHLASQDFEHNQQFFSMAASFGIAIIDDTLDGAEEALSRADVACYVAKAAGRNGIHLWLDGDSMVSGHTESILMASKVKQALDNDEVKCYGQLVVPLEVARPGATHCEVLTAIETEDGQRLTPDRYLPALEKFGLSTEYDHHVVATTLKAMSRSTTSQEMGWGWVSINLSAQTVCNPPSLDIIKDLFQRYSVPPTSVCFEITETAQLQNMSSALTFMTSLHEMGCMLALDDFGSGHSSFEHLLNLPFDIVKIDGQFITNLTNNSSHQSIVKSVCDLATQLDILTVAEMVEDAPTTELVRKLGVKYGQGFYLAGRQPLEELLDTPTELLQLNPKVLQLFGDKGQ